MPVADVLNGWYLRPWDPWGPMARVVVVIVIVYSGYGEAFGRAARLMNALAELAAAAQEVARAALDCMLVPA